MTILNNLMRTIKKRFRRNGILHTLLERNEDLALYAVGGTYSDMTSYWEVLRIQKKKYWYGTLEYLPAEEESSIDIRRFFINYSAALHYFDNLTYWGNPV
jgi:hypothetical protein